MEANKTFGDALEVLKAGKKVCRLSWMESGMYLWLLPAADVKREWVKDPLLLEAHGIRRRADWVGALTNRHAIGGLGNTGLK